MNVCVFDGNIGKDAELREAGKTDICTFPLAIRSGWGDNEKTTWVRCQIWGERGAKVVDYLTKGTRVTVAGEIHLDEYTDRDGYEQKSLTMDVRDLALPPKAKGGSRRDADDEEERPRRRRAEPKGRREEEEERPRASARRTERPRDTERKTRREEPPDHDDEDARRAEAEQDDLDDDIPF